MSNDASDGKKKNETFFTSEIFQDGPAAAGTGKPGGSNYSNSIGLEQGIEQFGGGAARAVKRARPGTTWLEPARNVPVYGQCDVLVVGGGPAGTCAAIAAARLGADVILVERYNHLGGLSTGGLVIWIDRMTDWSGAHVIRGLAAEIMDRHPRSHFKARAAIQGPPQSAWGSKDTATAAPTGRSARRPSTASSRTRRRSIPSTSNRCRWRWRSKPRCACCCMPGPRCRSSRATR